MKLVQSNKDFPDFTRLQALRYIFCQILGEKLENYDILSLWKTMSLSFPLFLKACKQRNDFKILQKKKNKSCSAIAILIAKRLRICMDVKIIYEGAHRISQDFWIKLRCSIFICLCAIICKKTLIVTFAMI